MLATIGKQLADLHINYETAPEYPLLRIEDDEADWTWRVEKMKLTKDKTAVVVNDVITLANIPPACFEYRLGNRSALEWVDKINTRSKLTNAAASPAIPTARMSQRTLCVSLGVSCTSASRR
jgi:predicted helicase